MNKMQWLMGKAQSKGLFFNLIWIPVLNQLIAQPHLWKWDRCVSIWIWLQSGGTAREPAPCKTAARHQRSPSKCRGWGKHLNTCMTEDALMSQLFIWKQQIYFNTKKWLQNSSKTDTTTEEPQKEMKKEKKTKTEKKDNIWKKEISHH